MLSSSEQRIGPSITKGAYCLNKGSVLSLEAKISSFLNKLKCGVKGVLGG